MHRVNKKMFYCNVGKVTFATIRNLRKERKNNSIFMQKVQSMHRLLFFVVLLSISRKCFRYFFSLLCFSFALPNKCKFFLECTESNLSTVTNGPNRMWISDKERDCILERKQERSERKSFFFFTLTSSRYKELQL